MAVPTYIRQINRRDILLTLQRAGVSTRSELARATGLSQPTAGKIVDALLAEKIVQLAEVEPPAASRMGRPGYGLSLNDTLPRFLAMQLGVSHTRLTPLAVAPPPDDAWAAVIETPTSLAEWKAAIAAAAKDLVSPSVEAVLITVPGIIDEESGECLLAPNLPWLEDQNIVKIIESTLHLPCRAVQEIRGLALGQWAIEPVMDSFLLVDFGVGVGSAAMIQGRLLQGSLPMSGELGHTPVPNETKRCGCGGVGCLETVVGRRPVLKALGITQRDWYAKWSAAINSPAAVSNTGLRYALESAGLGIAGALNVLGLDRVIVTGLLSELPASIFAHLQQTVQKAAVVGRFREVRTIAAPRRRLAGLAYVGIDHFLTSD